MTEHDRPDDTPEDATPDDRVSDLDLGNDLDAEPLDVDDDLDLDAELDAELDDEGLLGHRLRELLAPEEDLGRQTTQQVDQTLRARSVMATGMDLLGLGWLTMRELLTDEPSRADGESEGT